MSLMKYEPRGLRSLQSDLNQFFSRSNGLFPSLFDEGASLFDSEWMPRIDIQEDENNYVVTADVPGVDPKDIEVTMANGVLTIKGERRTEKDDNQNNYRRRECVTGCFERSFHMPESADSDNITAKGKNGVLRIQIGKKETAKARTIQIQAEE